MSIKKTLDNTIFFLYTTLLFLFTFSIAIRNLLIGLLFIFSVIRILVYREFNLKNNEFNFYVLLFLTFTFLSFFVARDINLSLDRFVSPILRYLFFFYISFIIVNDREKIAKNLNIFIYGNLTFAVLGILIKLLNGGNHISGNGTGTVAAFNILIFSALLFNNENNNYKKIFYLIGIGSFTYILFQTNSRGAVLGFFASLFVFIGFMVYYNIKSAKIKYFITILLIILVMITPYLLPDKLINKFDNLKNISANNSLKTRVVMWESSIYMIKNNPILGVGVGNFQPNYLDYIDNVSDENLTAGSRKHDHPHNMFLFIAAEQGIPSLLLFLIMIFISLKISLYNIYRYPKFSFENLIGITSLSVFIVFIVHSMVDSTARYGHVGFYILFILIVNYIIFEEMSKTSEN
ncbi:MULTISPECIES: O-antigen ligase family protein [Halanaerobium]|jgi:O-antigen ligase|uniref:O-antigen ligase n=1 Tax=Halanaerobium kushneri TaxID=56779 RepID=A0A1N7BL92_9FIRM|nr:MULTISPECIES: O-antigen ligase family protein [Halanaerobium]RCW62244.1 O-antigen ligase [Halanaerobium sp. ST460_2HS_T2]SIR51944.1 O-antigen ligase [Halanaerobium kushneri]